MANPQEVESIPPHAPNDTEDVQKVIAALRVSPRLSDQTRSLFDALEHSRQKDTKDYTVLRGILTAMLWIGSAAIVTALALTFIAILKR